jgi:pyruvate/2-oxoglutarate dehydrogenase complex dihydrolipoamide acyltransferase (E2) component
MSITEVKVPDIGDFESVEIIEVICKKGDTVSVEDPLISVESDKATMDVPSPIAGVIREIKVKVGEKVSAGSLILKMETTDVSTENEEEINIEKDESEDKSLATESDTTPVTTWSGTKYEHITTHIRFSGKGLYWSSVRFRC